MGRFKIEERYDLWKLATFIPNKNIPIHRWFYFKEGFSRDLVELLCKEFKLNNDKLVLDPFVGSGTTTLTCMELGIRSIGVDASPLAVLVASAKTRIYSAKELTDTLQRLISSPMKDLSGIDNLSPLTRRAFPPETLKLIISIRNCIKSLDNPDHRLFFTLCLMNAAMNSSYIHKDGSVVRIVKRPRPSLLKTFKKTANEMINDVVKARLKTGPAEIYLGDARRLSQIPEESIDAIITSPPYLNKIEYTKVYAVEFDLFISGHTSSLVRSYIGMTPRDRSDIIIDAGDLPNSAIAYLRDIEDSLIEMYRVLKKGGRAAIVVAGGVYPDRIVETDILISEIAEKIGFKVDKIRFINKRVATTGRIRRIGESRESILYFTKE
ncbi:MAG: DNA methyltransferase [Nitrososphaerota archaeon]